MNPRKGDKCSSLVFKHTPFVEYIYLKINLSQYVLTKQIPYMAKLSSGKTLVGFMVFQPIAKVFP